MSLVLHPGETDNGEGFVGASEDRVVAPGAASDALDELDPVQLVAGLDLPLSLGE